MCLHIKKMKRGFKEKNNVGYKVIYCSNKAYYQDYFMYAIGENVPIGTPKVSPDYSGKALVNIGMLHVFLTYKNAKEFFNRKYEETTRDILGPIKIIRVYFDRKDILYKGTDDSGNPSIGLSKLRIDSLEHVEKV